VAQANADPQLANLLSVEDPELDYLMADVSEETLAIHRPERVGYGRVSNPSDRRPEDWLHFSMDQRRAFYRDQKIARSERIALGRQAVSMHQLGRFPIEQDYEEAGRRILDHSAPIRDYVVTPTRKRQTILADESQIRDSIRHSIETGPVAAGYYVPGMPFIEDVE